MLKENKHSILVRSTFGELLHEVIRWGEAPWWPQGSLMRFSRHDEEEGEVRPGTSYRQKVLLPFAPSWDAHVEKLTSQGITRRFSRGMFEGQETVSIKNAGDDFEVSYLMRYRIKGALNRFLWNRFFRKLHDKNINLILFYLKSFLEKKWLEAEAKK
jgi:hypothetical protein